MNKFLAILLCALMLLSFAACKGGDAKPANTDPSASGDQETTEESFETGRLYLTLFSSRHEIKGLRLSGNRAGNEINNKEPALMGIRAVFELDEWIEYELSYGDSEKGACVVYLCPHRDFHLYKNADLDEAALYRAERTFEEGVTESFYVNPEDAGEGYYDLLFVTEGQILAYTVIHLYPQDALMDKTDAELEAMREEIVK